ncbi:hypothetical protein N7501_005332 [Penicillium viridicatum]|nr:hypothetical protein N7501_005332 [Penicillium viridicatum]
MAWDELNIPTSLPPHPNIVPFDRVVLEEESRVIGFTTKYIPGGTLPNSNLVDFLNLDYGIMHQDIAPRNLLIDLSTHKILLFDFDRAASGKKNLQDGRDDVSSVVFTLYELITNDTSFSGIPHWERNIDMVQSISEWTSHHKLESEVSKFRKFLDEWVATRRSDVDGDIERYLNAPNRLTLLDLPTAPEYTVPFEMGYFAHDIRPRTIKHFYDFITRDLLPAIPDSLDIYERDFDDQFHLAREIRKKHQPMLITESANREQNTKDLLEQFHKVGQEYQIIVIIIRKDPTEKEVERESVSHTTNQTLIQREEPIDRTIGDNEDQVQGDEDEVQGGEDEVRGDMMEAEASLLLGFKRRRVI